MVALVTDRVGILYFLCIGMLLVGEQYTEETCKGKIWPIPYLWQLSRVWVAPFVVVPLHSARSPRKNLGPAYALDCPNRQTKWGPLPSLSTGM